MATGVASSDQQLILSGIGTETYSGLLPIGDRNLSDAELARVAVDLIAAGGVGTVKYKTEVVDLKGWIYPQSPNGRADPTPSWQGSPRNGSRGIQLCTGTTSACMIMRWGWRTNLELAVKSNDCEMLQIVDEI